MKKTGLQKDRLKRKMALRCDPNDFFHVFLNSDDKTCQCGELNRYLEKTEKERTQALLRAMEDGVLYDEN